MNSTQKQRVFDLLNKAIPFPQIQRAVGINFEEFKEIYNLYQKQHGYRFKAISLETIKEGDRARRLVGSLVSGVEKRRKKAESLVKETALS